MVKRLLPFLLGLCVPLLLADPALAEPIGLQKLEVAAINENGSPDVQAGSHPYALVTNFILSQPEEVAPEVFSRTGGGLKNIRLELPPGFVGNPNATPKCSSHTFFARECPNDTAIGEATTSLNSISSGEPGQTISNPVYNLETAGAIAAEFGFFAASVVPIRLEASVRTGSDYGITINAPNIPNLAQIYASKVTVWGVPSAPVHDALRGKCLNQAETTWFSEAEREAHNEEKSNCTKNPKLEGAGSLPVQPFLTNPTSCAVSRLATLNVQSWGEPANPPAKAAEPSTEVSLPATLPPLSGCEKLDFSPSLSVQPDGVAGSTPTGLNVGVSISQESTTNPEGLGEADVKDTTVALPSGVQISPSASDGLEVCTGNPADPPGTPGNEIGFTRFAELNPSSEPGVQTPQFTPRLPGSIAATETGETEPLRPGVNFCPDASKIANVRVATPLLEHELTGAVYLAAPQNFMGLPENPFSSLIAMYLVAEEPNTGVLVKLPGNVALNEATGQITTTFENTPQLPFSELKLEFYGTARAPLATPALCGTYDTESSFVPWSAPPGGTSSSAAHPPASFQIESGPNGSACSDPLPFAPSLHSSSSNIQAGAFTPLVTTLSREDGQQSISSVQLNYPPGLSGLLTGVKLCGEAEANAGTCGPESQIGETIVSVGLGNDPFTVTGGKVYITGPYNGTSTCTVGSPGCAPFGLSIVNPAKAGPFDLQEGRPVVVRATVNVDPHTAALTVTTNSSGAYAIPNMIEGIPLQIKHVNVNVDRPGFTINPTNCSPMEITGTINSAEGASSPIEVPFQVTNCGNLKFAPNFKVSTQGKTSKALGASLTSTVTYPSAAPGTYANVTRVKVDLPKQLPSRLTTLQKACTNAQFEANPAGCPPESKIGYAVVHTPLLPVPLAGPAIFVSHGGEAFPSLTMVLQGYGVTVDLVGTTNISPVGITSTTFKTLPDSPFSSFELTLPEGKFSALGTNYNLCTQNLKMPTEFVGQNGVKINESTQITVTGCAKAKALTRAQKLTKALKACRKDHSKGKRKKCEKAARKKYVVNTNAKGKKKHAGGKEHG
jgi:hypothetical protein